MLRDFLLIVFFLSPVNQRPHCHRTRRRIFSGRRLSYNAATPLSLEFEEPHHDMTPETGVLKIYWMDGFGFDWMDWIWIIIHAIHEEREDPQMLLMVNGSRAGTACASVELLVELVLSLEQHKYLY